MSLAPGTQLGPYAVGSSIGAGGMGEVYRARDTKLDRDVAIKVLPDEFAADEERLARFEREAKLLASLNHPNIAALHNLEQIDGQRLLVMELVEGKTLSDLGKLPLDEALPLFAQLADGLAAAHDQGVLHRDLKPANVKVTPDDKVKILDFGLAKALGDGEASSDVDSSASPTRTKDTALGAILGTAPYMSPEQARGKLVDKRADVWAFGCCLYETLVGKQAFTGGTVTDTLAAILTSEPDLSAVPVKARPLLERCLDKDVTKRLRDVGDAHLLLAEAPQASRSTPRKVWVGALALALAMGYVFGRNTRVSGPEPATARVSITLPEGHKLHEGFPREASGLAISPDGSTVVYVGIVDGVRQLYARALDDATPRPLAGTEDAEGPFFSPDGEWVGFFSALRMKKVRLTGGAATTICAATSRPRGASWGSDGHIVFAPGGTSPLFMVSEDGGGPQPLTTLNLEAGERGHHFPQVIEGGVLYRLDAGPRKSLVFVRSVTGESVTVVEEAYFGRFVPPRYLLYAGSTTGLVLATAWRPGLDRAAAVGVPVANDVNRTPGWGGWSFDVSSNGTAVYALSRRGELVFVDRRGSFEVVKENLVAQTPRLSPDGSRIVYMGAGGLFVLDTDRGSINRVTENATANPHWHPDGNRVAFMHIDDARETLWTVANDGSDPPTRVLEEPARRNPTGFSPDGEHLLYVELVEDGTGHDLWTTTLDGERAPFLVTQFNETTGTFSPDGRYVAYGSDESGRDEIYVREFPSGEREWIVSSDGGREPQWPTPTEIFYRDGDRMMLVPVTTTPEFSVGRPEVLFEGAFVAGAVSSVNANYDVSSDGQRFVMLSENPVERRRLHVVQNWLDELERIVPSTN